MGVFYTGTNPPMITSGYSTPRIATNASRELLRNTEAKLDEIELADIEPLTGFAKEFPKLGSYETWRYRVKNRHTNGLSESRALLKRDARWWIVKPRSNHAYVLPSGIVFISLTDISTEL